MFDIASLVYLTGVFTTTLIMPFASAAEPLSLALPQDVSYVDTITSALQRTPFSTDPLIGKVLAERDISAGQPRLEIFITNNQVCVRGNEQLSYRVVVRNYGDTPAEEVTVQFQYPQTTTFRDSDPKPDKPELPETRLVQWFVEELAPGATSTYSVILNVTQQTQNVTVNVSAFYRGNGQHQTFASHTIDGPCSEEPAPATKDAAGEPAIVCDPRETGCEETYRSLSLGKNYDQALNDPGKGHVECDENGCTKKPILGPQFAEAIADIVPGECRVVEDDVITKPQFHDALNRRADPAALYMFPLYQSGQDFREFAVDNEIMGNRHYVTIQNTVRPHTQTNYQEHLQLLEDLFNKENEVTLANVVGKFDALSQTWIRRVENTHQTLQADYEAMQKRRKDTQFFVPGACGGGRFAAMACQAIENAKKSISRACGPPPNDGGLGGLLPGVYAAYDQSLNDRQAAYPQTQTKSLDAYKAQIDAWKQALTTASGSEAGMKRYFDNLINDPGADFSATVQAYLDHEKGDQASLNTIRLQRWEVALDTPKSTATACEKENIFPPHVETTWCEVGQEPEVIIRFAPNPAKAPTIQVPRYISGGEDADVPDSGVLGEQCGGKPGDPHWTPSCKCSCGEQVVCKGQLVRCEDLFNCTLDPRDKITHHDIHIRSQLECLWEQDDHLSPDASPTNLPGVPIPPAFPIFPPSNPQPPASSSSPNQPIPF